MELKKYRRIAGLTQRGLAAKAGVEASIISRLERGSRRMASYETVVRLARALNLEPEELVAVGLPVAAPAEGDDTAKRTA